jgi:mono/diheme cytochrome c family protein
MKRGSRIAIISLGTVAGVLALAAVTVYGVSNAQLQRTFPLPPSADLAVSVVDADIARGEHLVRSVGSCGECHADDLGGKIFMDAGPVGLGVGTNLTAGAGGVGATFTDEDWVLAIRHGLRRDGRSLFIMPSDAFAHLTDADLAAMIAYLRSVPPIDRQLPPSQLRFLGRTLFALGKMPVLIAQSMPQLDDRVEVTPGPTAEYGAYLAQVGGCTSCHAPDLSGGKEIGPPGSPLSSNLTPAGIGGWTQPDFVKAMREGVRPDGSAIAETMPWRYSGLMSDEELEALWLFIQTMPAREMTTK